MPEQHTQPTPTTSGQGCVRVLGVICNLHFWQNNRAILCATAVTRECNGHRIRTEQRKITLEKKILPPLLPYSKSQPFYHESGALPNEPSKHSQHQQYKQFQSAKKPGIACSCSLPVHTAEVSTATTDCNSSRSEGCLKN